MYYIHMKYRIVRICYRIMHIHYGVGLNVSEARASWSLRAQGGSFCSWSHARFIFPIVCILYIPDHIYTSYICIIYTFNVTQLYIQIVDTLFIYVS